MAETASPASSIDRKAASCVVTASRLPEDPQGDLGCDPERALRADERPEQVGPLGVEGLASQLDDLAVGQHHRQSCHVVDREAVLEAVRTTRVLGHVAADRAHLLARRVRRVEEALVGNGPRDVEVGDARLHDDALCVEVDLEDPGHSRQRDDDAVRDGKRAAGEAGAGSAGDERDAVASADPDDRLHLGRRAGEHDESRHGTPARKPVAVVHAQLLGLREHVVGTDDRPELGGDTGREGHSRESTASRNQPRIDDRLSPVPGAARATVA